MTWKRSIILLTIIVLVLVLAISGYFGKRFLREEVARYVYETAEEACGCEATIGNISVSLLSLAVTVKKISLTTSSGEVLSIDRIRIPASVKNILHHEITLKPLELIGISGGGLSDESILYKLIDHFSADKKEEPRKWRIKFSGLRVSEVSFSQALKVGSLILSGVSVAVDVDEEGVTIVEPLIKRLEFQPEFRSSLVFTNLGGKFSFLPQKIEFKDISAALKESFVKISGSVGEGKKDAIEAVYNFQVDSQSLNFPNNVALTLEGKGDIGGTLREPLVKGRFSNPEESALSIEYPSLSIIEEGMIAGDFELKKSRDQFTTLINTLSVKSNTFQADFIEPFIFSDQGLFGKARINAGSFVLEGISFSGLKLLISLAGTLSNPEVKIDASLDLLSGNEMQFGPLQGEGIYRGKRLEFKLAKSASFSFDSKLLLEDGLIKAELSNDDGVSFKGQLDFAGRGNLSATLKKLKLAKYIKHLECGEVSARFSYDFEDFLVNKGSGRIDVDELQLGCPPDSIGLFSPYTATIRSGKMLLPRFKIGAKRFALTIYGTALLSGEIDLNAEGTLRVAHIASMLPAVDDARGKVKGNFSFKKIEAKQQLTGSFELFKVAMLIRDNALEIDNLNGKGIIKNNTVFFDKFSGELNGGALDFSGEMPLFDPLRSHVRLKLKKAIFESQKDIQFVVSSNLSLAVPNNNRALIQGDIQFDEAQVSKNVRLRTVLRWLAENFYQTSPKDLSSKEKVPVDIDLKLISDAKVFLNTNFANLELKGEVHATGELMNPVFEGNLEALSGQFILRGHTFALTSANIFFESGLDNATIEAFGETVLFAGTVDETVIVSEITGPVYSPQIEFTSDQGLSQERIIQLLAGGDLFSAQTAIDILADEVDLAELGLVDQDSIYSVQRIVKDTTTLDRLSVQPGFNSETGQADVTVLASKDLNDDLTVLSESRVTALDTSTKMMVNYAIGANTVVSGLVHAPTSNRDTSFGVDVGYDLISTENKFLEVMFNGEKVFKKKRLLSALKLSSTAKIAPESLDRVAEDLSQFYRNEGYLDARVQAFCEELETYCRKLRFEVSSGSPYSIAKIELNGLPKRVKKDIGEVAKSGDLASKANLNSAKLAVIKALRKEGFYAARVQADYLFVSEESKEVTLRMDVRPRYRIEITFAGNSFFSTQELLDIIDFEMGEKPLGNNSMVLFSKRLRERYLEAGFVEAEVSIKVDRSKKKGVLSFTFLVEEGIRPKVKTASISGMEAFSEEEIRNALAKQSSSIELLVFEPEFIIPKALKTVERVLSDFYLERGYAEAKVNAAFKLSEDRTEAEVSYLVFEGESVGFEQVRFFGMPKDVKAPELPPKPYMRHRLKRYHEELKRSLKRLGYRGATVGYQELPDTREVHFAVDPAKPVLIDQVLFRGNIKVSAETLQKCIQSKAGDRWDEERFSDDRKKLLRLGLFSHIEFVPKDGKLNETTETLIVQVIERPLQAAQIGTGYDSEYGVHLFGNALDKSLFMDGRRLGARGDFYYDLEEEQVTKGLLSLRYQDPFFLETNYRLTEDFKFQRLDTPSQEFELDRMALSSFLSRSLEGGTDFFFGHTLSHENLGDVSQDAILGALDSGAFILSSISGAISYDQRDSMINTRSGYQLGVGAEIASEVLGSEANFVSFNSKTSLYRPFKIAEGSFGVALNLEGAAAFEFGGTEVVPISKRYYLGGRNSVRGFRENSLGPRGKEGSVLGGDLSLLGNFEFRYFPTRKWEIHTFFDTGNVNLMDRSFENLRESVGIGFRYISPIGPVGFDIGFPLDEQAGEPSSRVHFAVGMSF